MRDHRRVFSLFVAPLPLLIAGMPIAHTATRPPPEARFRLAGDAVPGLRETTRVTGRLASSTRLRVAITLRPRDDAGLNAFIAQVSDPSSRLHGQYLTKDQFATRFGRTALEVGRITRYLDAQGLKVDKVHDGNLLIDASGTAADMEMAFGTHLNTWRDSRTGRAFYANETAPSLPSSLGALVLDVSGLNDRLVRGVSPRLGPKGGLTPAQLKGGYGVAPLASTGLNGSGQTVAVVEFDGFEQSNITSYDNHYGLRPPAPTVHEVDGGSGALGSGQVEVELDIEALQAIAPKAHVAVFETPNTDAGEVDVYQAIVDSGTRVTSSCWGAAETQRTAGNMSALDLVFKQGAAEGLSFFAAAGDNGSDDAGDGGLSVDYPASDPYVTGVGGTRLSLTSNNTWSNEVAWPLGGGGASSVFAIPTWQVPVRKAAGGGRRQVPDVAAEADPEPGISVYTGGAWTSIGGTSAATPDWAALAALYNQRAQARGKAPLGFANPLIYSLGRASGDTTDFHDITRGGNGAYTATHGWDFVAGWGSYDATHFIAAGIR
ncbi:kumamolisin [Streptacidiphilus sp. EB103A]